MAGLPYHRAQDVAGVDLLAVVDHDVARRSGAGTSRSSPLPDLMMMVGVRFSVADDPGTGFLDGVRPRSDSGELHP
jgi:hypothetical protein